MLNIFFVFSWLVDIVLGQQCQINVIDSTEYVGCFVDTDIRLLPHKIELESLTDNNRCILLCRDLGYQFAGTEVGRQCFCGDDPWQYSKADVDSIYVGNYDCDSPCLADPSEICGGGWRLSVYRTGLKNESVQSVQGGMIKRRYTKMGTDTKLDDSKAAIFSRHVMSTIHCAALCSDDMACTGFAYSTITDTCQLYQLKFGDLCNSIVNAVGIGIYMMY